MYVLRADCKTHVPAGLKPHGTVVVTTGQRFLFSHRQEQLSHASETFVRKEEVAFLIGENWFLSSILPVRRIEIRTSRNPRIFFLYKMQFTRTSYNFSSSDIM